MVAAMEEYESVRLFTERAIAAQPSFRLTRQNALAVAQICHRLDGIPLAIELAAARMRALSVEQIAARLDDRFNLLTLGSREALPRHQTLRATIDWSFALLDEPEQALLARLSVFANGWTLEAAEAVCAGGAGCHLAGVGVGQVLDLLTRLVAKSLVMVEEQATEARYRLLETIREYAWEKLVASGESEQVQTCHRDFFLGLAQEAEPRLRRAEQVVWLSRLEVEHDNLRGALRWSLSRGDSGAGLQLAASLSRFWYLRGYWNEGRRWLGEALASGPYPQAPDDSLERVRAQALLGAGWLADESGTEVALYGEALAVCRKLGAEGMWGAAFALRGLGTNAYLQNDYEKAAPLLDESLALFREVGDPWGMGLTHFSLGWMAINRNDQPQAEPAWKESLSLFRQAGDRWGIAVVLSSLGYIARLHGDYQQASQFTRDSLTLFQELGDKAGIAQSLNRLGTVAFNRDEFKQAKALFEDSLAVQRELGTGNRGYWVGLLGFIACYQGDYARAVNLLNESMAMEREIGDGWGIGAALDGLALVAYYQGNVEQAKAYWEESLERFQEQKDKGRIGSALCGLGWVAHRQGDYELAGTRLKEGLALFREEREKQNIAVALHSLGNVACTQGDTAQAAALYRESLVLRRDLAAKRGIAESLEGLAATAMDEATAGSVPAPAGTERATRLFGAAEALRQAIGAPLPPIERAEHESYVAAARTELGQDQFASAWALGRAMVSDGPAGSWERAVAFGLGSGD